MHVVMSLYILRALEAIVKLGGNPLLEEIIQRLSLIYTETAPIQRKVSFSNIHFIILYFETVIKFTYQLFFVALRRKNYWLPVSGLHADYW